MIVSTVEPLSERAFSVVIETTERALKEKKKKKKRPRAPKMSRSRKTKKKKRNKMGLVMPLPLRKFLNTHFFEPMKSLPKFVTGKLILFFIFVPSCQ